MLCWPISQVHLRFNLHQVQVLIHLKHVDCILEMSLQRIKYSPISEPQNTDPVILICAPARHNTVKLTSFFSRLKLKCLPRISPMPPKAS